MEKEIKNFFKNMWTNLKKRQQQLTKEKEAIKKLETSWKQVEQQEYAKTRKELAKEKGRKKALIDHKEEMKKLEEPKSLL